MEEEMGRVAEWYRSTDSDPQITQITRINGHKKAQEAQSDPEITPQ
jgi:hypothetical protein